MEKVLVLTVVWILLGLFEIKLIRAYLPPAVSVCPRNSSNLNQCVLEKIEHLRASLISGDYGNGTVLDSIEPILIDHIVIDDGRNVRLVLSELSCRGAGSFILEKVSTNLKERRVTVLLTLPTMDIAGKYNMRLKISVLEINGKGNVGMIMGNVRVTFRIRYNPELVDGRQVLRISPVESKVKFEGQKFFNMTDLFKGNPALTAAANQAINANPEVILEAANPVAQQFMSTTFFKLASGLLKDASEDEMFSG